MKRFKKLHQAIKDNKTILGVGPMSRNCIDAVVEIANEQKIPIQLIASRRQIECNSLGGGYVATTEDLVNIVKIKDEGKYVYLVRDHGGPWQGTDEFELDHDEALSRAIISYQEDIRSGFDILHLDPSLKGRNLSDIIQDIIYLYLECENFAEKHHCKIIYEAGTEEHSGQISDKYDFQYLVDTMFIKCPKVNFIVGNMGYWVKELENVGVFNEKQTVEILKICNENNLYLKGHNSDYLSGPQLDQYNKLGVHSINIAPELGTRETEELLWHLEFLRKDKLRQKFIDLAVKSGKWKKWMKSDEDVPDLYKAKICGHYIFNTPEVKEIKSKIKGFDDMAKDKLKFQIKTVLQSLNWEINWSIK